MDQLFLTFLSNDMNKTKWNRDDCVLNACLRTTQSEKYY